MVNDRHPGQAGKIPGDVVHHGPLSRRALAANTPEILPKPIAVRNIQRRFRAHRAMPAEGKGAFRLADY